MDAMPFTFQVEPATAAEMIFLGPRAARRSLRSWRKFLTSLVVSKSLVFPADPAGGWDHLRLDTLLSLHDGGQDR